MAPDDDKRKPLEPDLRAALDALERGMRFNVVHSVARELIDLGYASNDWGQLAITEAGRVAVRRPAAWQSYPIISEHVSEMSAARITDDPFAAPHRAHAEMAGLTSPPPPPLSPPSDSRQRAQRAAGVASGKTNTWPDIAWVEAFIVAFDEPVE